MRRAFRFLTGMLGFRIGGNQSGSSSTPGHMLYADDNATALLADDNTTHLTQG
jgi:hypothetical protein